jgi:ferritin-like metal-binding protein YciE
MAQDIHDQLTKYITDAHAIEVQALAQLEQAPDAVSDPKIADVFRRHLEETKRHERETRALLDARDASPSKLKDAVMRVGGKGFLAFARAMPDTTGKLLAHAISYEALESAAYELLARTADRAGDADVSHVAREIGRDERAMIERLEACYDEAVDASLRELGTTDMKDQLRSYLADAHAIEKQAIQLLERRPTSDDTLAQGLEQAYDHHLVETREHAELIDQRLAALGGDPSSLKDAALRLGAMNWSGFFAGHPDTSGKFAAFAYAFEHLEIAGYEQLRRVADRAGDPATAGAVHAIAGQERAAAKQLESLFDEAVTASLHEVGVARAR